MDTSMGFTPLTGVMMGSRSGDVDPTILTFIGINDHWLDCLMFISSINIFKLIFCKTFWKTWVNSNQMNLLNLINNKR